MTGAVCVQRINESALISRHVPHAGLLFIRSSENLESEEISCTQKQPPGGTEAAVYLKSGVEEPNLFGRISFAWRRSLDRLPESLNCAASDNNTPFFCSHACGADGAAFTVIVCSFCQTCVEIAIHCDASLFPSIRFGLTALPNAAGLK